MAPSPSTESAEDRSRDGLSANRRTGNLPARSYLRWRDYIPQFRRYNDRGRTASLLERYRPLLQGTILDVCCGDSYGELHAALGDRYEGLDIGDSYKYQTGAIGRPPHVCNIEAGPLPFNDGSFDTVMCIGALEHLDNIHEVYDELFRVARQRVVIMLPNNWVGFIGSFVAGRNYTHRAGYGLGPSQKRPGERHKYFFNFEEAADFLLGRLPGGWGVKQLDTSFERGTDTWLAARPYFLAATIGRETLRRRFGVVLGTSLDIARVLVYYPVRLLDWLVGIAIWGTRGRMVYHNLMCREIWVVFDRDARSDRA